MCAEPDLSISGDRTLCAKHDAATGFLKLGAHWLITTCRKVRWDARHLIPSADVLLGGQTN
jgi:hypothetical protein